MSPTCRGRDFGSVTSAGRFAILGPLSWPPKHQMSGPPTSTPPPSAASDRLSSWKDIANYFGRSVRTVQRWEKQLGLPVHRMGTGRGEAIHALVHELETWRAAAEAALLKEREKGHPGAGSARGNGSSVAAPSADPGEGSAPAEQSAFHYSLALSGTQVPRCGRVPGSCSRRPDRSRGVSRQRHRVGVAVWFCQQSVSRDSGYPIDAAARHVASGSQPT